MTTGPQRKLRIAIFHATLPEPGRKPGGVEVAVHRLANALTEHARCEVTVFSCGARPRDALYRHERMLPPRFAQSRFLRLLVLPFLMNFVDFSRFDVLHLHGDDWFFLRRRLPTVRTLHGSALQEARFAKTLRRKLLQYAVSPLEHLASALATMSLAVGDETQREYRSHAVMDNGVDTRLFHAAEKSAEPLLFYVGTWQGRKRGEVAYRTFVEHVRPRWPGALLYMACDHVPRHDGVVDGGFPDQETLARWLARAWVFIYPSVYEGFGIPYIEALASGTAIVTTRNSGAEYVLRDGQYGIICDDADFGPAIARLIEDRELRAGMERKGAHYAERFSWQRIAERHVEAYGAVLEARSRGSRVAPELRPEQP